jgi:Gram-negative bacterial TonB protein C-terminal
MLNLATWPILLLLAPLIQIPLLHWEEFRRPVFPRVAQLAHIQGKATLEIEIDADGTTSVLNYSSSHPILTDTAMASLKQSKLRCENCEGKAALFTVVYEFKIIDKLDEEPCDYATDYESSATLDSVTHVTITTNLPCVHRFGVVVKRVRGSRCLYLWRCATRSRDYETLTRPR